jgi:hypothetical protein
VPKSFSGHTGGMRATIDVMGDDMVRHGGGEGVHYFSMCVALDAIDVITLNCTRHAYLESGHLTCYLF